VDAASFQFVLFGLATALVSNFSRSPVWRSNVLLIATIIFLGLLTHHGIQFLPLAGFLLLGYGGCILAERVGSRSMIWSISAVLLCYIWLKRYTFLPEVTFLRFPYLTLGLSYVLFRVLHLLIETADSTQKKHIGLGAYLLYTLNFTTFVSGPIQRYDEFAKDQFADQPISLGPRVIGLQLERIIRGLFKVNVLAMLFNMVWADALTQILQPLPSSLKFYAALRIVIMYPLFLYANFSGYIDIVIALARLMRLRLPENFNRPFSASSFLGFWERWHITLSAWLKTYVYNPLLLWLMRRMSSVALQPFLGVFCFFVTFFLVGIWHGRTSEFVIFGVLQGGGVAINKLWQLDLTRGLGRKRYKALTANPIYVAFGRGLTFSWFAFTLVWFWADWAQIDRVFSALSVTDWVGVWTATLLLATAVLAGWERLRATFQSVKASDWPVLTSRYARVVYATMLGLAAFVMTVLLNQPAPSIVYKAF